MRTESDQPLARSLRRGETAVAVRVVAAPDHDLRDALVPVDRATVVGRATGGGLDVADPRMSSRHVMVRRAGDSGVAFEDLGSKNGTFVNGLRSHSGSLSQGDVLRVGATVMVVTTLSTDLPCEDAAMGLVGDAPAFRAACAAVRFGASAGLPVLLLGPSGAGKEVMARLLHRASGRSGRFVALNCTAIPEQLAEATLYGHVAGAFTGAKGASPGFFGEAEGGTLFLDEVGDLRTAAQPRLLRALDSGEIVPVGSARPRRVDVAFVAATNVDLEERVGDGRFRADLFARLQGWTVRLPGLSERREDILRLARHFGAPDLDTDVAEALTLWRWPFNVRELRQVAAQLAARATEGPVGLADVPDPVRESLVAARRGQQVHIHVPTRGRPTREALVALLEIHAGNVSAVARTCGRERKQVYRWMQQFGLSRSAAEE